MWLTFLSLSLREELEIKYTPLSQAMLSPFQFQCPISLRGAVKAFTECLRVTIATLWILCDFYMGCRYFSQIPHFQAYLTTDVPRIARNQVVALLPVQGQISNFTSRFRQVSLPNSLHGKTRRKYKHVVKNENPLYHLVLCCIISSMHVPRFSALHQINAFGNEKGGKIE